jgi:Raf kinase inhibitor-like YbhB/YbcL family protein
MAFRIVSSAFKDGDYLPPWYSRTRGDSSPPIGWTDPPAKTVSLALIVTCVDDKTGQEYCHWVMYNIPPKSSTIYGKHPHGSVSHDGSLQGVNSFGDIGWDGPTDDLPEQELLFRLYALDGRLVLPGGASHHDVQDAMEGHVLEVAQLRGRFTPH